ncbi:hypothetical protein OAQ99_07825, partial [Candidatus Kapabacteria bacterium]|nr:hypothetical protein [Candidatus Kapabacteria bacterium]
MAILLYNNIEKIDDIPVSSESYFENIQENANIKFIFPTGRFLRYFKNKYLKAYFNSFQLPVSSYPAQSFDDFILGLY